MSNQEAKVARTSDLQDGEMMQVEIGDTVAVLAKVDGNYYAYHGHCTHYGAPLANGVLNGTRLRCPWHHACFDIRNGHHLEAPGMDGLPAYDVRVDGDDIIVRVPEDAGERQPNPMTKSDSSSGQTFVVLGGGAAGAYAAEGMRQGGFTGRIVMISDDTDAPYDRPNCSKAFLAGEAPEEWMPLRPDSFYDDHDIEVWRGRRVTNVDPQNKRIEFDGHEPLDYHTLVLCPGSTPRRPNMPGVDLDNVFTLRTLADSRHIRSKADAVKKAVIIGASFIGMEGAASLQAHDCEVTVVAPEKIPFAPVFGDKIGRMLQQMHEEKGVAFRLGRKVERLDGADGKVNKVKLDNGDELEADLVLIGIGVVPSTDFLQQFDREKDGGLRTNDRLLVRSGVYAAGDIAHFPYRGRHTRIEHWQVACQHGRIAGLNAAGEDQPFTTIPFFWTRQHGHSLAYIGHASDYDEIHYEGNVDDKKFLAFFIKGEQVQAVAGMGIPGALAAIQELMHFQKMPPASIIKDKKMDWVQFLKEKE